MRISKELKQEIKDAINCGKGTGYYYDGHLEDQVAVDTFDVDFATKQVIKVIKKAFKKPKTTNLGFPPTKHM